MSTPSTDDRKRKLTDPENSPAPKQIKLEPDTTSATPTNATPSMASSATPLPSLSARLSGLTPAQQQVLQAVMTQSSLTDEQKRKYVGGIESLKAIVESKGAHSPEGHTAQVKIDKIFAHLRQNIQRGQQPALQGQQVPSGAVTGAIPVAGATALPVGVGSANGPIAASKWIPPANIPPNQADAWRVEISSKLNNLGHKLSTAKLQVQEHQQTLDRGGLTTEQEAETRKKLQDAHTSFTQCKDILSSFYRQQKTLQAEKSAAAARAGQPVPGGMQAPIQPTGVPQQQQPQQQRPGQQQQPTQPGMLPAGVPQTQPNMVGRPPQPPQQNQPMQQPNQPNQPPQQMVPQQPQPQQTQPMQQQQQQVPRVGTPGDPTRAGSPPNVNSHVTAMNQARQQQQANIQPSMSPNQPIPNMPQQPQQMQNQQAQAQQPQQPGMVRPQGIPQNLAQQQQQQQQMQQQQQQAMGRSPAPTNVGTPQQMNSPVPARPGSVQPQQQQQPQQPQQQQQRPQSAAGTPIHQHAPMTPLQQQQQQQQGRVPHVPLPSPAVQREQNSQQTRMPIPQTLSVPHPTPVAIPAARPSLSGGANTPANQILGTPAIIKQPNFEYDEGGGGLLSKRKLEELVKQIDPEEKLDPDVEESALEIVDEFIDTVVTAACRMAKMRGSDTLDIKDLQFILERNYNIRIPGFSADEIRSVRKFNPAQGYHHKINALTAQKQLAQAAGKNGE